MMCKRSSTTRTFDLASVSPRRRLIGGLMPWALSPAECGQTQCVFF